MPLDEEFTIRTEAIAQRNVIVVRVSGYLDAHTFEQLEDAIADLFNKRHYRLIVDLAKVPYISSAGAGVFIGKLSEAQEHNGNIVLLNPTSHVRDVFDLLGLTQVFSVVYDQRAALQAF